MGEYLLKKHVVLQFMEIKQSYCKLRVDFRKWHLYILQLNYVVFAVFNSFRQKHILIWKCLKELRIWTVY